MGRLVLRPVWESDEEFLIALHHSVSPPLPPPLIHHQYLAESRGYESSFGSRGHEIIEVDGAAAGRWWVCRSAAEIRLVDIRLLAAFRNRGLGTELIERLQAEARATDSPLRLSVRFDNPAALRLYQRLGFGIIGEAGMHLRLEWSGSGPFANPQNQVSRAERD